jgi:hypothetical protein
MKYQIFFMVSIVLVFFVSLSSGREAISVHPVVLKQEVELLKSNANKNVLREQVLANRDFILIKTLEKIEKLRNEQPTQVSQDEAKILKAVLSLKSMISRIQAQYNEGQ